MKVEVPEGGPADDDTSLGRQTVPRASANPRGSPAHHSLSGRGGRQGCTGDRTDHLVTTSSEPRGLNPCRTRWYSFILVPGVGGGRGVAGAVRPRGR